MPYTSPEARLERLPRPVDIYPLRVDIYRLAKNTRGQFGWSHVSYTICEGTTTHFQAPTDVELRLSDICRGLPEHVAVQIPPNKIIDIVAEAATMQARHDTNKKLVSEQLEEAERRAPSTSGLAAVDQKISTADSVPLGLEE